MQVRRFVMEGLEGDTMWQIGREGTEVTVALSPLGKAPTPIHFRFDDVPAAEVYVSGMVKKMLDKGFIEMETPTE